MRHAKQYKRGSRGKAAVFFVVLFGFAIFSMLLPLRPTRSEIENRDLTKFPAFSAPALARGTTPKASTPGSRTPSPCGMCSAS